jgi:glucan biosynthesis protein C
MGSRLAPAILAVPIGFAFSLDPTWLGWLGVRTPNESLVTNLQAWIGFGTAFGFGWLLHRQTGLLQVLERRCLLNLGLAIGLIAVSFLLAIALSVGPRPRPAGFDLVRFAGAVAYALAIWTTTFATISLALRFLSDFSATRRYLADASYWLYLIHMPIVMALQVAVSQLDLAWPVKFGGILLVTLSVLLASYQLLVRYTFVGAVLNGRRMRREPEVDTTAASTAVT